MVITGGCWRRSDVPDLSSFLASRGGSAGGSFFVIYDSQAKGPENGCLLHDPSWSISFHRAPVNRERLLATFTFQKPMNY